MAAVLDRAIAQIQEIQAEARSGGGPGPDGHGVRWPMIVLRTPKGWTGPATVDGRPVEGTWRAHQVPLAEVRTNPEHVRQLQDWMLSYRPDELFDGGGRPPPEILGFVPAGARQSPARPGKRPRCRWTST
jgi:xylulose-5-phosphate/fructose-6-phosphate phosphoketolase